MIRIVGVQRDSAAQEEFVLLQNQGGLRVGLKGHILLPERVLERDDCADLMHIFRDDVSIAGGNFVLLHTGVGESRWTKTRDLQLVYHTFANRLEGLWDQSEGAIHLLAPQHGYVERKAAALLLR